jgi:hypothetical protein
MLYDLNWLAPGKQFPPQTEKDRLEKYRDNRLTYDCVPPYAIPLAGGGNGGSLATSNFSPMHPYFLMMNRLNRVIGDWQEVFSILTNLSYQQLVSIKTADLLCGEPPNITSKQQSKNVAIETIIDNTGLYNKLYTAVIDTSRFGDGLIKIYSDGNKGLLTIVNPERWFPVCDPSNTDQILYHVLAWIRTVNPEASESARKYKLYVEIHSIGSYETREYEMRDRLEIGQMVASTIYQTGLSDFAVVQLPNVRSSGNIHGRDDYTPIDPIIMAMISRIGQISKILDKHASPSMEAPESAFSENKNGEYTLKAGDAFIRNSKEDAETKYITWDGNLEAAFIEFEKLLQQLYAISEMGAAIFGDLKGGIPPSGAALRRLMVNALTKVSRIRNNVDPSVKNILALLSEVTPNATILKKSDIEIQWQDGLPSDPLEEAQIINLRVQAPTMSATTAMQRYDNMGIEQAEEELQRIQEQALTANPVLASAVEKKKDIQPNPHINPNEEV